MSHVSVLIDAVPSVKSSIDYEYKLNKVDSHGYFTHFSISLAGLGGDVSHLKTESQTSFEKSIFSWLSLSSAVRFGLVFPFNKNASTPIADRFFLNNSFLRGLDDVVIGPRDKGLLFY